MNQIANHLHRDVKSIAVIGNYLPRKCGIATFTTDLAGSLCKDKSISSCFTVAMNDRPEGYEYPDVVQYEIGRDHLNEYSRAAEFLNRKQPDVVCLQHEFGIFGGNCGEHILTLMKELEIPIVTTLHTVLVEPSKKQKEIMKRLSEHSARLVVMSRSAVQILQTLYDIPGEKIAFIPHGIPDIPFDHTPADKKRLGLQDRKVLLTFGLLSENKGIEYVIRGLPEVVKKFPDIIYIVLGATHPGVLEHEGERYRNYLQELVQDLGLEEHVVFENHFVPFEELCSYLLASDIYITPYNNEEQITSGTLAYACGAGKAVVSTPYWYAQEMLSDGRGRLVPFKNAEAISGTLLNLFENEEDLKHMQKRAYDFSRNAVWKEVASQYARLFREVVANQYINPQPRNSHRPRYLLKKGGSLPPFKIDHLLALTDDTGILQHASYNIPNRHHGYCTDDNARALLVAQQALRLENIAPEDAGKLKGLSNRYLSFLAHAFNPDNGRFRNFMSYSRQWLDPMGSEDAHGRALWALGASVAFPNRSSDKTLGTTLFTQGLDAAQSFKSPRAIAFTLIGLSGYLKRYAGNSAARRTGEKLSERLYRQFEAHKKEEWPWPEEVLTYSNARLPHALILAGEFCRRRELTTMGLKALKWLLKIQTKAGHLSPIGNNGWYQHNGSKARFDQQPLDANALVEACIAAHEVSGEEYWRDSAGICFNWFLGQNDLKLPLYDSRTGGCRDGLEYNKVNENQGAESTLAWLLSLTAMHHLKEEKEPANNELHLNSSYSNQS
ncbi:MAG TPA: glycosyltransferase family 4 protein [Balneolaceae bacterium]